MTLLLNSFVAFPSLVPGQPVLLSALPYLKILDNVAGSYDVTPNFASADNYTLAPGSPALPAGVTLSAAGLISWGNSSTPQMDVYLVIRARNTSTGLYVDHQFRLSVAQNPGAAPAPTLSQQSSTTIRVTRGALPANTPPIICDVMQGPASPLSTANAAGVHLDALTAGATFDITGLSAGATRIAKLRYRIAWGDGTSYPPNFNGAESAALTLSSGTSAPSIVTAGSISPASGPVGTVYTLIPPVADGGPTPTVTLTGLTQAGVDVLSKVSGGKFTSTASGALFATWTAANGTLPNATSTATAAITSTSGATWFDTVFARRNGAGVGPRTGTTPVTSWLPQTGVSLAGSVVTVSGSNKVIAGVDFTGYKLVNSGANNVIEDCVGDINAAGQSGNNRQWDIGGLNPTVRYCRMTNPARLGGVITIAFNDATGGPVEHHNDWRDAGGQDVIRGPDPGAVLASYDTLQKGIHLVTGAHVDVVDMRGASPGSSVRRLLSIGDKTAESVAAGGGTGYTNAFHELPTDPHGSLGNGLIFEECILVGHDDPGANSIFIQVGGTATTGIVMYDILYDLREHNSLLHPSCRVDDWYMRPFDYATSLAAGQVTGIGAPTPFPNLANQPAAVPSTMAPPVITPAAGGITYAAMVRPANQRSLITGYTLEWSFDGSSWTAVSLTPAQALAGGFVATPTGANLRTRVYATNGIGNGAPSAASNQVTIASSLFAFSLVNEQGSASIAAADMPELEITTDSGATWQTLTAAGFTLAVVSGKLRISGLTPPGGGWAAGQVKVRYKDGAQEPFFGQDTPGTTDATGALIKEIYARHASGPRPALGATTVNNLPGVPIVGTRWNQPVVAS